MNTSTSPSPVIKLSLPMTRGYKTIQQAFKSYYGKMTSARDQAKIKSTNSTTDALNLTSMPTEKTSYLDSYRTLKPTTNRTKVSSPDVTQMEVKSLKSILRAKGSFVEGKTERVNQDKEKGWVNSTAVSTKISMSKEKPEKQIVKRESIRRELLKTAVSLYKPKEEIFKQVKVKEVVNVFEEQKKEIVKVHRQQVQLQPKTEHVEEKEKEKIKIYFRYKMYTLAKLVEDKMRIQAMTTRTEKFPTIAVGSSRPGSSSTECKTPILEKAEKPSVFKEVWRILKIAVSTQSRFKHKTIVNYNKRIRDMIKSLTLLSLIATVSKSPNRSVEVNLSDKSPTPNKPKKSKSPRGDKIIAFNDLLYNNNKKKSLMKVFILIGGYGGVRKALKERGWIENPDQLSQNFDLKWGSRTDIKYDVLQPHQYVNHFEKSTVITTKVELSRNLRDLVWGQNDDIDRYFPRCYDLSDMNEFEDFLQDFMFEQAVAVLRVAKSKASTGLLAPSYKLKLCAALMICERRLKPFDELVADLAKNVSPLVTDEEWEIVNQEKGSSYGNTTKYSKLVDYAKKRYMIDFDEVSAETDKHLFAQAELILARLEREFPQCSMNQGKNVWIVKPAGLSRGRGIGCHNSLIGVLDHIKTRGSEWIAQKYIENPLIIKNRKFDIRQWVLVTDWNPLTIWFYDECYVRFTAQDFNPNDLSNKYAHLTNNAIAKNAANFETSEIEGNMWDCSDLRDFLRERAGGTNVFENLIKPQMKNIVIKSFQCTQDVPEPRKNTFELYGYDFMIDDNNGVWLLEINASPCMEYSTRITERLVKMVLEDCIKVVVDHGMSNVKDKKDIDTGKFKCIYAGKPTVKQPQNYVKTRNLSNVF